MPSGNGTGFSITLTHIAIGTALYAPTGDEVALKQEAARYPIGGGTNPTPQSVQTGVTITDTDPQGRSPNGLSIGEIGWFGVPSTNLNATPTLVAVWSRVTPPLFVKSPQFDVPFAYTLDISAFPDMGVTVSVSTDPQGMATLILQHEAKADPHSQYMQKVRGTADYDPKLTYAIGAKVTGPDGKTYRSLVNNNTSNTPATNPTKWERWGHSVAEMDAEFVPRRTVVKTGSADALGIVRVQSPDGGTYAANGTVTGALKIAFPAGAQQKDSVFRMRVDIFDLRAQTSFSVVIAGHVTAALAWEGVQAAVIGQVSRDVNIRYGNDGTKPCLWIGELTAQWSAPRVHIAELMVSNNADGGDGVFWAANWAVSLATVFGSVAGTLGASLVFGQTDVAHVAGLSDILAAKQALLGYTPVQQGGGVGQLTNKLYMGWSGTGVKVTVDSSDLGTLAFLNSPGFTGAPTAPTITDPAAADLRLANSAFVQSAISRAMVGQIHFESRTSARAGFAIANGAELSRTDYPALWAYAQTSGALYLDSDWSAGSWGGFSYGPGGVNGTTFRIPCLTGEFIRCWDAGRGVDANRKLGSRQATQNLSHAHGASAAAVGDHVHSAYTDGQGSHAHGGGTSASGDHQHVSPWGEYNVAYPWGTYGANNLLGQSANRDGDNSWPYVSPSGNHAHSISTDVQGYHGHNVGINGAGSHSHTITINADGGTEARPINVAVTPMIRIL